MEKVLKRGKRVFAMLMAVLLVLGLVPVSPVKMSAADGSPILTINVDKTMAHVTVMDGEGNLADSSIDDNSEDNKLIYAIVEGATYSVTFEELDSNVIFDVRDTEGRSVTLTEKTFEISDVTADSVFEYNVYFESDTSVVTVNYDDAEIKSLVSNVGQDVTENNVTKYRVLKTDDLSFTVTPQKPNAIVTAVVAGEEIDCTPSEEEIVTYSVALGACANDTEVNLSVEKVTVNASTTIDGASLKVYEDEVEVFGTDNVYTITKGSKCYIEIETTLESRRLVVTDGGEGIYAISDDYKIELGTLEGNKTVVISEKESPKVVITVPNDKVSTIVLKDEDGNVVDTESDPTIGDATTTYTYKGEEGNAYTAIITPTDDDAIVTADGYEIDELVGDRTIEISALPDTGTTVVTVEIENQYKLTFNEGYGTVYRTDTTDGNKELIENGELIVSENDTEVELKVVPETGKYISGLTFGLEGEEESAVTFTAEKLDVNDLSYVFRVNITKDAEISVSYSDISVEPEVLIESVLNKEFGDARNNSPLITDEKEVYHINSAVVLESVDADNGAKVLFDTEEGFVSSKSVNEDEVFTDVTVLINTTFFEEGMLQTYSFTKELQFAFDDESENLAISLDSEAGITEFFGPLFKTVDLKVKASDKSGISKVVYFTEDKNEINDRNEILDEETNVLTLIDDVYTVRINEESTADKEYFIYAIDNAENIKKLEHTVTYDGTDPTGGSITIETEEGLVNSFLDFATVQKNKIKITATDVQDTGSGIESIKASLWKEGVDHALETIELYGADKKDEFEQTGFEEGKKYYVSIVAIDKVGNTKKILETKILGDVTRVVYDGSAPVINATPNYSDNDLGVHHIKNNNVFYISEAVLNNGFLFDVLVKDYSQSTKPDNYYASGLETVTVKVNGNVINLGAAGATGTSVSYDALNERTNDATYKVKLKDYGIKDKYEITLISQDQAGNVSQPVSYIVYVDNKAPMVSSVTINGTNATLGNAFQTYGFFTKDKFDIQFNGIDGSNETADSKIARYVVDYLEGNTVVKTEKVEGNLSSFTKQIADNFKGTIRVTVYDNVGNSSTVTLVNGLICEKESTHAINAGVALTTPVTSMKDVNGVQLYAENTSVGVVVTDSYAGINNIEWSVVAPFDTENNASGAMTAYALTSGWTADSTDNGIVTKVSGTIPVTNNSNNIVVKVTVTDNVGNVSSSNVTLSIDKTTPTINVSVAGDDADTQYTSTYNGDRVATITLRERNFKAEDVKVTITNTDGVIPSVTSWKKSEDDSNPDNNTYTATVTFAADGDYTLDVAYTDLANRTAAAPAQQKLTIDKTLPVASVGIDGNAVNGFYFATGRTATIVIDEHNFDSDRVQLTGTATNNGATVGLPSISAWSSSGNTHTATIRFTTDADYQLVLSGVDKAGNTFTYEVPNFVIDQEVPTITITGVENQSANAGDVVPVITLGDVNYDTNGVNITLVGANNGSMELDGSFSNTADGQVFTFNNFPNEQSYDDIYTLTATKTDMAGNETTETITFSVNRFGSVYTLSDELKEVVGKYVKEPFEIVLTETNIDRLDPTTIKVVLTINGTPKTLVLNEDYTISETGSDASWKQYVYTINPSVFEGDGSYSLALYSVDTAGNVNENINEVKEAEVVFGIDTTAPIIEAINFQNGFTNETAYTATISAIDNIILKSVQVLINGEVVDVTEENGMYSFIIPESASRQTIVVTAVDEAGNEATMEYTDILITSNPFISFINNTPLLIGSIAGVAAVGGGAGAFVFFRRRNVVKIKK